MALNLIEQIEGIQKKSRLGEHNFLGYGSLENIKQKSHAALMGADGLAGQAGNTYFNTRDFEMAAKQMNLSQDLINKVQSDGNRLSLAETLQVASAMIRDASSQDSLNWKRDMLGPDGFIQKMQGFGLSANLAHSGLQFVKEAMSQESGDEFTIESNEWSPAVVQQLAVEMTERDWAEAPLGAAVRPLSAVGNSSWTSSPSRLPTDVQALGGLSAISSPTGMAALQAPAPGSGSINRGDWQVVGGRNGYPFLSDFDVNKVAFGDGTARLSYENNRGSEIRTPTLAEMAKANGWGSVFGTYDMKYQTAGGPNKALVTSMFAYTQGAHGELGKQGLEFDFEQGIQSMEYLTANVWQRGQQEKSNSLTRSIKIEPGQVVDLQMHIQPGRVQLRARGQDGEMVTLLDRSSGLITEQNVASMKFMANMWHRAWGSQENSNAAASINVLGFDKTA